MQPVKIGNRSIGAGFPTWFVAEIGINHNGDIRVAKELIDIASAAGCDAVKFQKRTPEICVPSNQQQQMRETPWGYITYLEYRNRVELGENEYTSIAHHSTRNGICWLGSCWDKPSVDFLERFEPPCYKIPSACLTDDDLLRHIRRTRKPIILSTGMSTLAQIDHAVDVLGPEDLIVLHCTSTYPAESHELNLRVIPTFQQRYDVPVGYSGHESFVYTSLAAVALGACVIERHITLSRSMWGSDHAASLEPNGLTKLVKYIRATESSLGDGKKILYDSEKPIMKKLRRQFKESTGTLPDKIDKTH